MSTLSQTTDISVQSGEGGGLPWWGILLIIIGCILVAVAGVAGYHFYSKRKFKKIAEQSVKEHDMQQLSAKKPYVVVGDD